MSDHPATQPTSPWRERIALPRQSNEQEFADKVLGCLEPWFKIDRQVRGRHALLEHRPRIDAVLRPLNPAGWKDAEPAFGVEFKHLYGEGSTGGRMKLAAQAIDYSYVDWHGYGRLPIFMCSPGKGVFPVTGGWEDHNYWISHLLGQFTIGELCYLRGYYWTLQMHGYHMIWNSRDGVHEGKHRTIVPKVGSR